MKQIEYKGVVIRPRTIPFEEWQADYIKGAKEEWLKRKNDPDHYVGNYYSQTEREFEESVKKGCATEYFYWDRQSHWFIFFLDGRIVRIPKLKSSEDKDTFFNRVDKAIAKVDRESTTSLGRFAALMQRLLNKKLGMHHSYVVYPTTYGIGLWAAYNFYFEEHKKVIEGILNDMGVEYYNEYSDAQWAYRFKISKKEANRVLIYNNINREEELCH